MKSNQLITLCSAGIGLLLATGVANAQSPPQKNSKPVVHGEPIAAVAAAPAPTASAPTNAATPAPVNTAAVAGDPKPVNSTNAPSRPNEPREVSFEELASYDFEPPASWVTNSTEVITEANKQIPTDIKKLDGKKVTVTGFMLPFRAEKGQIMQFLVLRNQSACCYGVPPLITEWVNVRLKGDGPESPVMDQPITVEGTLRVGAVIEDHIVVDLYRMDGAHLVDY